MPGLYGTTRTVLHQSDQAESHAVTMSRATAINVDLTSVNLIVKNVDSGPSDSVFNARTRIGLRELEG